MNGRMLSITLTLVFFFGPATVSQVSGQATTGEITGRVTDASGAAVPGASVTALNEGTGFTRTITTSSLGEYTLTLLPPGLYSVSAELSGFKKTVRENIAVNVGTRQTVGLALAVGAVTEEVLITSEAPLIETTRSDLGGVVDSTRITNLPLINRTFANLSVIMPEARPAGNFDPTKTRVGNFAMSGGDGRQVDINVDGGDNKDNVVGSLLQNFAYESIQEFQVLEHRWSAESGRAVGGVINVISKSGTNGLHGSVFGTYRNQNLVAKDFFQDRGATKAKFERWEYGGSLGGPIVRDKLFFFGAIERFDEPSTLTPLRSPAVLAELTAIPNSRPVNAIPTPYDDTLLTAKVDHQIGGRQSMFYRFAWQKNSSPNDQVLNPATTDLSGGNTDENKIYDGVVNHTATFGGDKVNQLAFHFQDFKNEILAATEDPIMIFPTVRVGPPASTPQATTERKFQFRDDFSWYRGKHSLKVGSNYIYTKLGGYFYFGALGHELTWFDDPVTITTNRQRYPQGFATPGAVQALNYFAGAASHDQNFHQLAFYVQDDWRAGRNVTLNLGLRWDANIDLLTDQTNNRTMQLLGRVNHPRAQAITSDAAKLSRTTPSWTEFQPRIGFAYDAQGNGSTVIRGGYGIFFDQIFQNLTVFSLSQTGPEIYSQILGFTNSNVGVGQLPNFRFGVDPLPAPPPFDFSQLPAGSFGRITDPDAQDPYVHKFSAGFQRTLGGVWVLSSDYVHSIGRREPRVLVINPLIRPVCDPTFAGSTPADARCVRGATTRFFDQAFVQSGLGANRLGQINMVGTTNESKFDSWTTTLRGRARRANLSVSYILANSRSWGGQPSASYSGNGIAVTPEQQFQEPEWGPTRHDERHRFVANSVFDIPGGFQLASIVQWSSSRPYTPFAGFDINGDGLTNISDRLCEGVNLDAVFAARGNLPAIGALNPNGCQLARANSKRGGLVADTGGSFEERSGRFFNADLRVTKTFSFGDRAQVKLSADFFNLFNTENLSFTLRPEQSSAASSSAFLQPVSLFGPGFGPPVGRPFTASFGARFQF